MITLVKTTGGNSGTPDKCKCGSIDFIKAGIAWNCGSCGSYVPAKLVKNDPFQSIQKDFEKLKDLHGKLKGMLSELEKVVKE